MTLRDRIVAYTNAFPGRPPLQVVTEGAGKDQHDVIYGQWVIGNDYRNKTRYYGAYPHGYLDRIEALFPDVQAKVLGEWTRLHAFSGSIPAGAYDRCDLLQEAEWRCSIYDLNDTVGTRRTTRYSLVLADPPYTAADANRYKTPMIDRGRAMRSLAEVTRIGGHVVWLDCCWPMHRKSEWRTVGRIGLTRSTNHRVRMVSIFERVAA